MTPDIKPDCIYVGLRAACIAEVGGLTEIYAGKYLVCPTGDAQFDCEGCANKTELKRLIAAYRSYYPGIRVCYV
jgi:hypothetical protein